MCLKVLSSAFFPHDKGILYHVFFVGTRQSHEFVIASFGTRQVLSLSCASSRCTTKVIKNFPPLPQFILLPTYNTGYSVLNFGIFICHVLF
jgi:hypothetical protein